MAVRRAYRSDARRSALLDPIVARVRDQLIELAREYGTFRPPVAKFDESEPRDEAGKWTSGGDGDIRQTHAEEWARVGAELDHLRNPTTGERGMGNCYPAAYRLATKAAALGLTNVKVCQGTATPRAGRLAGVSFGHAWVEADPPDGKGGRTAYDWSSHNRVAIDAGRYRTLGSVTDVVEYTPEQAMTESLRTGHYGPWK